MVLVYSAGTMDFRSMANIPLEYRLYYESLRREYPDMKLVFERNDCCQNNIRNRYSIADWYGGGHYFANECKVCGHEWWMDETELGLRDLDYEDE